MRLACIVILLFCYALARKSTSRGARHLAGELMDLYACADFEGQTCFIYNMTNHLYPGGQVKVNAVGGSFRDCQRINKVIIHVRKCREMVSDNTCEHFVTWTLGSNSCELLQSPQALWYFVFDAIEPRLYCPIKKGVYKVNNVTMNLRSLEVVPMNVGCCIWEAKFSAYDENTSPWCCLVMNLKFYWKHEDTSG